MILGLTREACAVPTVWSGLTKTFTKTSFSDYTLPQNQDQLTEDVVLTRGSIGGLINYAAESIFFAATSPVDTEWATDITTDQTIAASNWQNLVAADAFTGWLDAYGGQQTGGSMIAGRNAVVHLISDDVYLDLRFTSWTPGGGGGYSYMRAEPSAPIGPTGDYNGDSAVEAADYVIWRQTLGDSAAPNGSGADGNSNGSIEQGDYTYWRERYGNAAAGLGSGSTSVPEPMTVSVALQLIAGLLCTFRRRSRTAVFGTNSQHQSGSIHLCGARTRRRASHGSPSRA